MLILGLDTATQVCSAALVCKEQLIGEYTLNIRKTHSQRLMPLLDALLTDCGAAREEISGIAVAAGPGSFTGLRIGVSTARALAQGLGVPAAGVSTLEAIAEQYPLPGLVVCPLLDARRGQVYAALYRRSPVPPYLPAEIIPPSASGLPPLLERLASLEEPVLFLGEGAAIHAESITAALESRAVIPPAPAGLNRASLVALCGARRLAASPPASHTYHHLRPVYLRQPEAERRREEAERHR